MYKRIPTLMIVLTLIVPGLCLVNPAIAGEKPAKLDEMVVTGTRSEEKIQNLPVKIELIDAREIELTTGETITEQLKKNSSIGVIEYPGALAGIGIRGFRPEFSGITKHSLILIDGRPAGATNLSTILSDNIERIEVLKGPASSLYGGEAMGGVVNVITKKNTGELTGMVELGYGSFDTNFQKAALGGSLNDIFDFDLSARRYDQQDDLKMGNGDKRANTEYMTQNADVRLGANLGGNWRVDMGLDAYQGRDIKTPGDIFKGDIESGHKDIDRHGFDVTAEGQITASHRLGITGYKTRELSESYKHYAGWPSAPADPYQSYDSEINWIGLQLKDEITWQAHKFIFGADYQDIDKESRSYNKDNTRKAPYSPDESRRNIAGYLETIWKIMDNRMTFTAGGRYDTFDVSTEVTAYKTDFNPKTESFSTFSPRAGLNYLFDSGIRIHTTIGKAFVPPSAAQLAGYSERLVEGVNMITKGNPNLDPESSVTYDLGMGYARPSSGFNADLTYFHSDVDDKIITEQSGNTKTYKNGMGAEMHGLEYLLSYDVGIPLKWNRSFEFFVNGTRIFSAEEELTDKTQKDIHNVSNHTVNYGIGYSDGLLDGKLHFRSQGPMKDTDWNAAGYPEIEYPGFTVVDLVLGVKFYNNHKVTLKVDNLLDHNYYEKKGFPKPGRGFFVSYNYTF
ncbi:TonB-dependent receptor plug domain-containing protein [Desulfobacula toluolica]|uniref:TonB-dependent receptor n=1 Tax=Desulfobacula toluolica (strain DSM 7467 / Tol2) TaxID=651182 RepID=K0NCR5_DESTT|nr:TonB-dependent receptor [Desulfobacula toluolica]CCK82349.1 TonB-dependent receptor [Desulfobacula toluolica Tol2]